MSGLNTCGLVAARCLLSAGIAIGLGGAAAPYPAAAETVAATSASSTNCSSPQPCFQSKNSGSGIGIAATAANNSAATGTTISNLNSSQTINLTRFPSTEALSITFGTTGGLVGYDNSTNVNDLNSGVLGFSSNGTGVTGITQSTGLFGIGVVGYDLSKTSPNNVGVFGFSGLGIGVFGSGHTINGVGVWGNAADGGVGVVGNMRTGLGVGVYGNAPNGGFAVFGRALTANGLGVFGNAPDGGTGVKGISTSGYGVIGGSQSQVGVYGNSVSSVAIWANTGSSGAESLRITNTGGGLMMRASNASAGVMSLDSAGNMILAGSLTQFGSPNVVTQTARGNSVVMYAPKQSVATVEDVGETQLVGGQALVAIDPAFAATMDRRADYLVFLTPQGDSNGLYVTQKTAVGFLVREHGGRSNIAFDYRIVGKPFGSNEPRLATWNSPLVSAPRPPASLIGLPKIPPSIARLQNAQVQRDH